MKFLSQLFEARGTDLTSSAFRQARRKLITIYLLIIAAVITLFSVLVVMQVDEREAARRIPPKSEILLNTKEALRSARAQKPGAEVVKAEYEMSNGQLLYEVHFDDDESLYVDVITGRLDRRDKGESAETIFTLLTDDTNEIVSWLGLVVFLLASIGSILVANATLQPIAVSTQKQKRFVSDAAHELRNPLAALQTTLESYIRSNVKSKELNDSVARELLAEVKRLISTSEALLSFEKIESKKSVEECSVVERVASVSKRLENQILAKHILITTDLSAQTLSIDPTDLETILYNLLHNAIKFSDQDAKIIISWKDKVLTIRDTGRGIESIHLPHIFERFYKVDQARTLDTDHSDGLGLALVQELITSYGGSITVDSVVGEGTTFTVTFL